MVVTFGVPCPMLICIVSPPAKPKEIAPTNYSIQLQISSRLVSCPLCKASGLLCPGLTEICVIAGLQQELNRAQTKGVTWDWYKQPFVFAMGSPMPGGLHDTATDIVNGIIT